MIVTSIFNMAQRTSYIFALVFAYALAHDCPTIDSHLGKIKGYYKTSYGGRAFSAFEGIPYAKPPLGELRFREPQPAEPWTGIWDATVVHECIQLNTLQGHQIIGNEDCLYINVYVPKINSKNLNVIVHIHGGAFVMGSGSQFGPEYFMDTDVIYVSVNYRLGALGFLSTEDNIVPGNNGMKDQVVALKWIQQNIEYFGGNPKSITLTGLSAGAVSVHFHYISPLSKGLFHKAISQSGTVLNPWGIQKSALDKARKLAASVGCDFTSTKKFIDCMRQRPVIHLVENVQLLSEYPEILISIFAPVVERKHESAFLTEDPFTLLGDGNVYDVPWIASATTDEGIFPSCYFFNKLGELNEHWNEIMPHLLEYNFTSNSIKTVIGEKIRKYYFGTKEITHDNFPILIKLFGDRHFHVGIEKAARMQAKVTTSPVYLMLYGHRGELSLADYFKLDKDYGVSHGDDAVLVYYQAMLHTNQRKTLSNSDEAIKDLLLDIITSFAESGHPNVKNINWKPLTKSNEAHIDYLYVNFDQTNTYSKAEISPQQFWNTIRNMENGNIAIIKDEL